MPPRKRKQEAEAPVADPQQLSREEVALKVKENLEALDRAVEQRCKAIAEAAQEIVETFMQDFRVRLMTGVPKQLRGTLWSEYAATRETLAAPATTAEARVESVLQQAQEASVQTVAGGPRTTRAGRSRARGGGMGAIAEEAPATSTRTRRGAAAAGADAAAAALAPVAPVARQPVPKFDAPPPAAGAGEGASAPASPSADAENRAPAVAVSSKDAAEARVKALVDAKLAAVGGGGAGRRTVARGAAPGEALFSAKGSPLSVLPGAANGGRATRGALQIGLTPAPAPANTAAVGCVTLIKREAPAAAARGNRGRGRKREMVQPEDAIMITTMDGQSFMVDGSADALAAIPQTHRAEVQQQLVMLQRLAASALGATVPV